MINSLIAFIKSGLKEISPLHNIKSLNTNIRADILAGITVAIIALPLALAFGVMSGLGPAAGVWGAIVGGIVGGLFGGCMVGVSGPTAPKAAQIALFIGGGAVISTTPELDLGAAFSIIFLSGLILVVVSMLRISHFIHYTPYSVVAGFMSGIGVIVILTQINAFIGLPAQQDIMGVFKNLKSSIQNIKIDALYVSIPSLLILFLWPLLERKNKILEKIPAPLVALIVGTSIAFCMDSKIPYIGDQMGELKSEVFSFYIPNLYRFFDFIGPALALAALAILDSLLSCIVADNMTGKRHSSDRETFGQGMANMAAGLFGGVTTATATMRTVANIKFGGKTPLASIVHGLTLLAILLGLSSFVAAIPKACLAAILFKVGIDILDYRILPVLRKLPIAELVIFVIVLFVTVYADLMVAVAIGVAFACLKYFKEIKLTLKSDYCHEIIPLSQANFSFKEQVKHKVFNLPVSVLKLEGPLFFGTIESLKKTYSKALNHEILVIDMSHVTTVDLSGAYALEDIIKGIKTDNVKIFVLNPNSRTRRILERFDFIVNIGKDHYKESEKSIIYAILKHYQLEQDIS